MRRFGVCVYIHVCNVYADIKGGGCMRFGILHVHGAQTLEEISVILL